MDGNFLDSNGETLTFRPQSSNLPGGVLVWEGTTTMIVCPCPPFTGPSVDTRLTVTVTNTSPGVTGTPPVALAAPATSGVAGANAAEVGGLVPISPRVTRFRVNFKITARLSSPPNQAFETAETFYNARTHPATHPGFVSSITGAFWYENRPPVLEFTYSDPQADKPIDFTATSLVDPDGAITSNGWDFTNDNVFESSALSAQWSFATGDWPVSLVAVDNERNAQWPAGRKTVLTKMIAVPVGPAVTPRHHHHRHRRRPTPTATASPPRWTATTTTRASAPARSTFRPMASTRTATASTRSCKRWPHRSRGHIRRAPRPPHSRR